MDLRGIVVIILCALLDTISSSQIDCHLNKKECPIKSDNLIAWPLARRSGCQWPLAKFLKPEEFTNLFRDDSTYTAFTRSGPISYPFHEIKSVSFPLHVEKKPLHKLYQRFKT